MNPLMCGMGAMNVMQMLGQLKQNQMALLKQAGFNVPDEIVNNPQAAVMHLVQTGQVGGGRLQQIMRMMGMR